MKNATLATAWHLYWLAHRDASTFAEADAFDDAMVEMEYAYPRVLADIVRHCCKGE